MGSLVQAFTRRKFVDPNALTSTQLNRCLSIFDLTFIGTGTTIGAGLFVLAGDVARNSTGPSIVISFLIAGIASVLSGLCYAEFGARVPKAGSAYVYSYVAIGELCALIIGWSLTLEYLIGSASVGKATSLYVDSLFHEGIKNFTISTIGKIHAAGIAEYPDLMAVLIILVTTIILITGIKKSSWSMTLFTGITLFVILFIVCVGAFYAEPKNWSNDFMPYGMSGVMTGAATCFYAFVGFDVIATTGEEARNPSRAIPISIILTLSICFLAYFGVSAVLTLMWPYSTLPESGTIPEVFAMKGAPWAKYVISVGALGALISSLLGQLISLPRLLFSMASDGLIFKFLAKVSPMTDIPMIATLISGSFSAIFALILNLHDLVEMISFGTLSAYTMVAVCVLILRYHPGTVGFIKQTNSEAGAETQTGDQGKSREDSPLLGVDPAQQHPSQRTASLAQAAIATSCIGLAGLSALIIWGSPALSQAKWWAILAATVISLLLIGCTVLLLWLPQNKTPLPFMVPCVPVLPLITVFIDLFLILNLSYLTLIRFAIWMAIGISIYLFYGLRNSVEGKRQRDRQELTDESHRTCEARASYTQSMEHLSSENLEKCNV